MKNQRSSLGPLALAASATRGVAELRGTPPWPAYVRRYNDVVRIAHEAVCERVPIGNAFRKHLSYLWLRSAALLNVLLWLDDPELDAVFAAYDDLVGDEARVPILRGSKLTAPELAACWMHLHGELDGIEHGLEQQLRYMFGMSNAA